MINSDTESNSLMPVLFVGHGNPLAIEETPFNAEGIVYDSIFMRSLRIG